jgi:hypothetical protein
MTGDEDQLLRHIGVASLGIQSKYNLDLTLIIQLYLRMLITVYDYYIKEGINPELVGKMIHTDIIDFMKSVFGDNYYSALKGFEGARETFYLLKFTHTCRHLITLLNYTPLYQVLKFQSQLIYYFSRNSNSKTLSLWINCR